MDDNNCVETHTCHPEYEELFYQMLIRVSTTTIPFEWLVYVGSGTIVTQLQEICKQMQSDGSKVMLRAFLADLEPGTSRSLRALVTAYDRKDNIRMFTLPTHIVVEQIRTLRKLYNVPDGDPAPTMGRSMVCLQCKQFKGFVSHMNKGKPQNLFAYGHSKVLIDYDDGKMYCGKKCDKVEKKRNSDHNQWDLDSVVVARRKKRSAKDMRKHARNKLCASCPLMEVPLLGNILQFYGTLYTVCPQCGNFMKFHPNNMFNGMYCGCCLQDGKPVKDIQCARCGDHQHLGEPILVAGGESIYLCRQHYNPWIREANSILEKSTILKGLEEKWKRLQSV